MPVDSLISLWLYMCLLLKIMEPASACLNVGGKKNRPGSAKASARINYAFSTAEMKAKFNFKARCG